MSNTAHRTGPRLLPVMQYRDLGRAIDWLKTAFGFEEQETVRSAEGQALYAVMRFDDSLIMLGPVRDADLGGLMKQPDEVGGAETQSCYIIVDDVEAHSAQAKAAGASVVFDLTDYEHGGRGYSCRDPEGHIWTFGTYDPRSLARRATPLRISPPIMAAALALALLLGGSGWLVVRSGLLAGVGTVPVSKLETERTARESAERQAQDAHQAASREHAARQVAERQAQLAEDDLGRERVARGEIGKQLAAAESARDAHQQRLQQLTDDLDRQRRAVETANQQLAAATAAKDETSRRLETVTAELDRQHGAIEEVKRQLAAAADGKEDAQRQVQQARQELEQARASIASLEKKLAAAAEAKSATGKQLTEVKQQLEHEQASAASLEKQLRAESNAKEEAKRAAEAAQQKLTDLQADKREPAAKAEEPDPPSPPAPKEAPQRAPARATTGANNSPPMPALVP